MRALLKWRILGEELVGTHHLPACAGGRESAVGALLLNAGPAPRGGNSDLSVHMAERLAARGFHVFRFDFHGLGDSSGSTPGDLEAYWREVLDGRNDEATVALIRRIRHEFGLARIVVGGLCSAIVPAVRAIGREPGALAGLILLEPPVGVEVFSRPGRREERAARLRRLVSPREWLHLATGESRVAHALRPVRRPLLAILRRLEGHALPRDANVPFVLRWQESFARGIPSLVVVAAGQGSDRHVSRVLESLPGNWPARLSYVRVQGNHLFTSGRARDEVLAALERWAATHFGAPAPTYAAHQGSESA